MLQRRVSGVEALHVVFMLPLGLMMLSAHAVHQSAPLLHLHPDLPAHSIYLRYHPCKMLHGQVAIGWQIDLMFFWLYLVKKPVQLFERLSCLLDQVYSSHTAAAQQVQQERHS